MQWEYECRCITLAMMPSALSGSRHIALDVSGHKENKTNEQTTI